MLKLDGELATIERDGDRVLCGGGARLPSAAAKSAKWGLSGPRVRGQHPRHRRRRGADERERLRRRARAHARMGLGLHRRRGRAPRARRPRLLLPPLQPGEGEVVARASFALEPGDPDEIKATLAGMRSQAPRGAAVGDQDLRLDLQEPRRPARRGPLGRPAARRGRLPRPAGRRRRFSAKHANFVENVEGATHRRHPRADGRSAAGACTRRSASSSSPRSRCSARSSGRRTGSSARERADASARGPRFARLRSRPCAGCLPRGGVLRWSIVVLVLALALGAGYVFWLRDSSLVAIERVEVVGAEGAPRSRER